MNKKSKTIFYTVMIFGVLIGLLAFISPRLFNQKSVPVDLALFSCENPARIDSEIKKMNTVTFTVEEIGKRYYTSDNYKVSGPIDSDFYINAFLSKKDAVKIDVGDTITVQGEINTYSYSPVQERATIYVGWSDNVLFLMGPAKLLEVE